MPYFESGPIVLVSFLLLGYPDPLSGFNSRYYCKSFKYMSRYNLFKRMNILNYLKIYLTWVELLLVEASPLTADLWQNALAYYKKVKSIRASSKDFLCQNCLKTKSQYWIFFTDIFFYKSLCRCRKCSRLKSFC